MKQTFLLKITTPEGEQIDFFRHSVKQLKTVISKERKFWSNQYTDFKKWGHSLFAKHLNLKNKIIIYKSEYEGCYKDIVFFDTLENFLQEGIKWSQKTFTKKNSTLNILTGMTLTSYLQTSEH